MKKYLSIILVMLLTVSLSACGKNENANTNVSKKAQENNNSNLNDKKDREDKAKMEQAEKERKEQEAKKREEENVKKEQEEKKRKEEEKAKKEQEDKEREAERIASFERAGIENIEKFDEMFNTVKKLVAEGNKEKVAEYMRYPISHNLDNTGIRTKEEFIKNYDKLFTEEVKKVLADTNVEDLYGDPFICSIICGDKIWFKQDGISFIVNEYDGSFDCNNEFLIELDFSDVNFNEDLAIDEAFSNTADSMYRLLVKPIVERDDILSLHAGLLGSMVKYMGPGDIFQEMYNWYPDDFLKEKAPGVYEFFEKLPKRVAVNQTGSVDENIIDKIILYSDDIPDDFKNKVIDKFSKIEYEYLQGLMDNGFKITFKTPNGTVNSDTNSNDDLSLRDYYPTYLYDIKTFQGGFENGGERHYIDFINGDKVQWRFESDGTSVASLVQVTDEEITVLYSQEEVYDYVDLTDKERERKEILLKTPIEVGNTWPLLEGETRTITGIDVLVSTPAGEYKALEVTTTLADGSESKTYYAPGVGLIKDVYIVNDNEMGIILEEIHKNMED